MLVPDCEVPAGLPEDGMPLPLPGAVVPDCPIPGPGFALPVAPEPVPGVVLGWVADGAGVGLVVLPPEPFAGALPVPVLPPLVWASAGAAIAATIASVARLLMTRDAMTFLLGAARSLLIGGPVGQNAEGLSVTRKAG
jgi:hypothetical protein